MESFLKQHFAERADNPTRRQWRERRGVPRLSSIACPKVDKILKQNLSSQTKARDRQLSKSQALVLDAVGPLAFVLDSAASESLTQDSTVEAVQTALKLLGNASCHLATERRKNVLANLNPTLKELVEKEDKLYMEVAPNLFGDGFSKKGTTNLKSCKVQRLHRIPPPAPTGRAKMASFSKDAALYTGHQRQRSIQRPQPLKLQ